MKTVEDQEISLKKTKEEQVDKAETEAKRTKIEPKDRLKGQKTVSYLTGTH